jgi:hypothetical protein
MSQKIELFYQTTRRYIPDDFILHSRRSDNPRSHKTCIFKSRGNFISHKLSKFVSILDGQLIRCLYGGSVTLLPRFLIDV